MSLHKHLQIAKQRLKQKNGWSKGSLRSIFKKKQKKRGKR